MSLARDMNLEFCIFSFVILWPLHWCDQSPVVPIDHDDKVNSEATGMHTQQQEIFWVRRVDLVAASYIGLSCLLSLLNLIFIYESYQLSQGQSWWPTRHEDGDV